MGVPLSSWPWENLGDFKYLLIGPLVAKVVYSRMYEDTQKDHWCLYILLLCALRGLVYTLFCSINNMHFLTRNRRVTPQSIDFKQIDREWHWDNFIILQAFMVLMACYTFPMLVDLPLWNSKGYLCAVILHVVASEPLYYWVHKQLHTDLLLFTNYHSLHHSSSVQQPPTAGHATPLEHLIMGVIMAIPVLGTCLIGFGSTSMIFGYILIFDFLRCWGHSYIEFVPNWIFKAFPFFKYLLYTPTYHYLHHIEKDTNFCLFMPMFDALGNTLNSKSWELHQKIRSGLNERRPDFVFLIHCVDIISSMHAPFLRSFVSHPFTTRLFLLPLWPIAFLSAMVLWVWGKPFMVTGYTLRGKLHQSWCVPRYGFQYFLPFAKDGINDQIEDAILSANKLGIKVISLAALNKNESLNGGGTLFVKKHPYLRVRVAHGNTLTAAVILKEIPEDVKEVFLTGSTSKLGRAIALYLCRKKVRVMMLTQSTERFQSIQMEASEEYRNFLVHVTKYQAGKNCNAWIAGNWITPRQQRWAPKGTHFHQFVVPNIMEMRRDCTYGKLAAMKLPEDVEGLGTCEYSMGRGIVHACHAGGVVHLLEGYKHHEVGNIDVDMIDVVWNAAMKHGLRPV